MHLRYMSLLCVLLVIKAVLMIEVILHAGIGLGPDEAQYWTWSRLLDWGYYSKPPGIAWEIWIGTQLFGNNELGVRMPAVVIGFCLPLLVYRMARNCGLTPQTCFWSALTIALSPIGIMSSFLAITDGGMILFWTATCTYLAGMIQQNRTPNYLILGLLIMCGALFKWPIYLLWLLVLLSWSLFPWLASWRILLGCVVSLLALLPSIYWNAEHEWGTFRHVLATLAGGHAAPKVGVILQGNLFEFMGAQAAIVSPILFVLLVLALVRMVKDRHSVPVGVIFCGGITLVILTMALVVSFFMKLQGNWAIYAYPSVFVVLGWYGCEALEKGKRWLYAGVTISVLACSFVFSLPFIQAEGVGSQYPIPYRINPFRHNVGWNQLTKELLLAGYDAQQDFLFGDKYQMASILSFYGPDQKRAYFLNLHGTRKNQFSFWPSMAQEQVGKRGFFVVVENMPHLAKAQPVLVDTTQELLKEYFKEVHFHGVVPLFWAYGQMVKGALIFECVSYNGLQPEGAMLY